MPNSDHVVEVWAKPQEAGGGLAAKPQEADYKTDN